MMLNEKLFPVLKNLRIALITAMTVVLVFGLTDILSNKTNTIEVVSMIVLALGLGYICLVSPKLPTPPSV